MTMVLLSYFRMVSNRHLWIVKNIPQWTIVPTDFGMVKMAYKTPNMWTIKNSWIPNLINAKGVYKTAL
jgi:hypothetical protein